jgi:hypothetical protein
MGSVVDENLFRRNQMSSAHFYPLIFVPVVITAPGKYLTRCGETVTVEVVSTKHDFGCTGFYDKEGIKERWHKSGRIFAGQETQNDIISAA